MPFVIFLAEAMPCRGHLACPDRFNTGNDHGPHQYQGHGAGIGVIKTDNPFVTGKQVVYIVGGSLVDGKKLAGHIDHFFQFSGTGHVNAVVVFG